MPTPKHKTSPSPTAKPAKTTTKNRPGAAPLLPVTQTHTEGIVNGLVSTRVGAKGPMPKAGAKPTVAEMEHHIEALLRFIGEDPQREGLQDTPARVLRSYREHFSGYSQDASEHLATTFTEVEDYDELVLVSDIEVFSHCEHHMVPFVGKAHVAYIPNGRVVGLSKIARVVDVFAKRLQVQEKLTAQIAGALKEHLAPQGVAVVMQCQHFCMCYRGVKKPGSWTTTSKLHGCFLSDPTARMELLTLIGMPRSVG